jgi:hypothetical protein
MLKINPGHPKVWLSQDHIRIGLDATAVTVGGLSPTHQRLLRALELGIADNQLGPIAQSLKLSSDEASDLIGRLEPVLLAADGRRDLELDNSRRFPFAQPEPDFAEIIRFGLNHNVPGESGLLLRSVKTVHIDNLGRTGLTTIRGLASAGVTQFWCSDSSKVAVEDTTPLGYPKELLDWPKFMALDSLAGSFQNPVALLDSSRLRSRSFDRLDLAIVFSSQVFDPKVARIWLRKGIPHIGVVFDASGVRVSPVVIPGKTPCLSCRDEELASTDPNHSVIFNQLLAHPTRYDDSSSVLFAASAATVTALAQLDSQAGFESLQHEKFGTWFERKSGLIHRIRWPSASNCMCAFGFEAEGEYQEVRNQPDEPTVSSAA